jgi:hypothetical protein
MSRQGGRRLPRPWMAQMDCYTLDFDSGETLHLHDRDIVIDAEGETVTFSGPQNLRGETGWLTRHSDDRVARSWVNPIRGLGHPAMWTAAVLPAKREQAKTIELSNERVARGVRVELLRKRRCTDAAAPR